MNSDFEEKNRENIVLLVKTLRIFQISQKLQCFSPKCVRVFYGFTTLEGEESCCLFWKAVQAIQGITCKILLLRIIIVNVHVTLITKYQMVN